jgi:hypothetical protein
MAKGLKRNIIRVFFKMDEKRDLIIIPPLKWNSWQNWEKSNWHLLGIFGKISNDFNGLDTVFILVVYHRITCQIVQGKAQLIPGKSSTKN